ncbi:MAG: ATP-binding cassette domain-containing protein [Butyrivibrio sp.]|nr:ATP-binding cassette domain-containing protein [Butyrivibrio sp.]
MISTKELSVKYKGKEILKNINIEVLKGEFCVLFGPDDAGKTTLIKCITGFKKGFSGEVIVDGKYRYVPDEILLMEDTTVGEFLNEMAYLNKDTYKRNLQEQLIQLFGVDLSKLISDISYEDNKCVQIIAAVSAYPDIIILDEPMNFMNNGKWMIWLEFLKRLNNAGMTIFITSEIYESVLHYATSYIAIKEGEIIRTGNASETKLEKVISIKGGNSEILLKHMKRVSAGKNGMQIYSYDGDMKELAAILKESECEDYIIENQTMEENIVGDYTSRI